MEQELEDIKKSTLSVDVLCEKLDELKADQDKLEELGITPDRQLVATLTEQVEALDPPPWEAKRKRSPSLCL